MSSYEAIGFCPACESDHLLTWEDRGPDYLIRCSRAGEYWSEEYYGDLVEHMNYMAMKEEDIEETLEQRGKTYGDWKVQAQITEDIISAINYNNEQDIEPYKYQALCMIASKIARIVNGDSNHIDSWRDIEGYARLVRKELERD